MSSAATLLLTLSIAVSALAAGAVAYNDGRLTRLWHYRWSWTWPAPTSTATPAPLRCTGNRVPVPCDELGAAGVNRYCPAYGGGGRTKRCGPADLRRAALCACTAPNRVDPRGNCMRAEQCRTCGRRAEVISACTAHCEPSCDRPEGPLGCPRKCVEGCVCKEGYLRDKASGECVLKHMCPGAATTPPPLECAGNKVPVQCGDMNNTDVNRYCPKYEAAVGYKSKPHCRREEEKQRGTMCACRLPNKIDWNGWYGRGACIPAEQCPTCPPNERFTECSAQCPPLCRPLPGRLCTMICAPGCICKRGYTRDTASGKCVRCPETSTTCYGLTKCPGCTGIYTDKRGCTMCKHCPWRLRTCRARFCGYTPSKDIQCPAGLQPVPCGIGFIDRQCSSLTSRQFEATNRTEPCSVAEKQAGARCGCAPPNVLNGRRDCVPLSQCDTCDPATEVHSACKAHCQPSCATPEGPSACKKLCVPGCVCDWARGYLRDGASGKCVPKDTCPGHVAERCRRLTKCPGCTDTYTDRKGCTRCKHCPWRLPICKALFCGYTPAKDIKCAGGTEPVPCGIAYADRQCPALKSIMFEAVSQTDPCSVAEKRAGARCGCKAPKVLNGSGACVPPDRCNIGTCDAATERYSRCSAHCEPSCSRPRGRRCRRVCSPGCVCRRGYLRHRGECVPRNTCPATTVRPPKPTATPTNGVCASHHCPQCHRCMVNDLGEARCVHRSTCYHEFPDTGCPPGQNMCQTIVSLCHWAKCTSGYSCIANHCECKPMYYDPHLNQVDTCSP